MIRLFYYAVPVVLLVFFVAVMQGGNYLREPLSDSDNVPLYISKVADDVRSEDWDQARQDIDKLDRAFRVVTKRIQFSVERDALEGLTLSIARAKGMIEAKDKAGALAQMYEADAHWNDLGR